MAVGALLGGCHIDLSGLNDLLDAGPTYLNLPGRKIAAGQFSAANVQGSDDSGAYVIAFTGSPATIAILPFEGGAGCVTGPANSYPAPFFGPRSTNPFYLPYLQATKPQTLHFASPTCKEPVAPIVNSGFPLGSSSAFDDPGGFLTLTGTGQLLFVEPWASAQPTVVAANARNPQVVNDKLWAIETAAATATVPTPTPQLVARDLNFKELMRFGSNVKEYAITGQAETRAVYVDVTNQTAGQTGGDLYVVTDDMSAPKQIDTDACNVLFPGGYQGLGVSYLSPCETRTLVLYGSQSLSQPGPGKSDTKYVVADSIIGRPAVAFSGKTGLVFYITNDDATASNGDLFGGNIGSAAAEIAQDPQLDRNKTPILNAQGSEWQAIAQLSQGVGNLIRWKPGVPTRQIASGVEEVDDSVALVNFDGKVGDLVQIGTTTVSSVFLSGVPAGGIDSNLSGTNKIGVAVLSDYNGAVGTLMVSPPDTLAFEKAADGVPNTADGFALIGNLNGVGYLHDFDARTGEGILGVRVIKTGDTFDTGISASEWVEVGWPQPGLLYVVKNGSDRGIWFSGLK